MHFGRIGNVGGVDFSLPADGIRTENFLKLPREGTTRVFIGCPIWACKEWLEILYPKGTKTVDFLKVYSTIFPTVEVNSTFYNMLPPDRIAAWREKVPKGFLFCPKVFRGISEDLHSPNLSTLVKNFCHSIEAFGENLGLTFAQFSERFGPAQLEALSYFIQLWPKSFPLAIELRHQDWFRDHALLDDVVNLFYKNQVASVITDTAGRRDVLHLSLTQPRVLIRFQGNNGHATDETRVLNWLDRIRKWEKHHLKEIYFLVHQPEEPSIPKTALFALGQYRGARVEPIPLPPGKGQSELF